MFIIQSILFLAFQKLERILVFLEIIEDTFDILEYHLYFHD